ncbi:Six-hairpin glycosidase [Venustampulla echinocandica]|uniref:Six-hairpin glycosidase n=1 Tax=Venustampulla echinocandica TaxID=2656787 RepID=A0A370THU5_9HELO|nr:Six-hairpin glycosidase [Venustampulla echinocandica]RDL34775.1 Six-hairpin glycosidase [Venustampulla echinocandica]
MQHVFSEVSTAIPTINGTEAATWSGLIMVLSHFSFRLFSVLLSSIPFTLSSTAGTAAETELAFNTLQEWYSNDTGLWTTAGWWNSANCLTTVGDLAAVDSSVAPTVQKVFSNTLVQAQKANLQMQKVVTASFNVETFYGPVFPSNVVVPESTNTKGFLNGFYDDEGWWALGWIQAYDVTKNTEYLQTAMDIFNDMSGGGNTPCGGIWWDKAQTYVNAIANELYLSVAAHLANRLPNDQSNYLNIALKQWNWFENTGMINSKNTINDGLTKSCEPNNGTVWSYNQGVILGGLVELATASGDPSYLLTASTIASAAISALSNSSGVLHDPCEPNCGGDGSQFKGIFMRNLGKLQTVRPKDEFLGFIESNKDSILKSNRDSKNRMGVVWSGPVTEPATASSHSSAMDALVAALALGV